MGSCPKCNATIDGKSDKCPKCGLVFDEKPGSDTLDANDTSVLESDSAADRPRWLPTMAITSYSNQPARRRGVDLDMAAMVVNNRPVPTR